MNWIKFDINNEYTWPPQSHKDEQIEFLAVFHEKDYPKVNYTDVGYWKIYEDGRGFFHFNSDTDRYGADLYRDPVLTHWMPLPNLPRDL